MTKSVLVAPWLRQATGEPRPSIVLAVSIAALLIVGAAAAKQQCSVSAGKHGYWSWRMIDDRKCWYEGKPMLSRALLEWPEETATLPHIKADSAGAAPAVRRSDSQRPESQRSEIRAAEIHASESHAAESHGDPMDAQAYAPADPATFEALWRDRIEGSRK
jgi:hypothetical protein